MDEVERVHNSSRGCLRVADSCIGFQLLVDQRGNDKLFRLRSIEYKNKMKISLEHNDSN